MTPAVKLVVQSDVNLDPHSSDKAQTLSETQDWEILGLVVFNGRVDALVFVERRYFLQVNLKVFEGGSFAPPKTWRVVTGDKVLLPDVDLILAHEVLASDPLLLADCVGLEPEALERLRNLLAADDQ
jgi:hypothetical protein